MMSEDMPNCPCGVHDYSPGGGSISGGQSTQWFTCNACSRPTVVVFQSCGVMLTPTEAPLGASDEVWDPKAKAWLETTLNTHLCEQARRAKDERSAREGVIWDATCDQFGLPRGTKYKAHRRPNVDMLKYETPIIIYERPDGAEIDDQVLLAQVRSVAFTQYDALPWGGALVEMRLPQVPPSVIARILKHDATKDTPPNERWVRAESATSSLFGGSSPIGPE